MYNEYPQQEQVYRQEQAHRQERVHTTDYSTVNMYSQPETFSHPLPHNDVRFAAALTYVCGWFSGLLFAIFNRNRYIRFHALQSTIFFGAVNVVNIGMFFVLLYLSQYYVPRFFEFLFLIFSVFLNVLAFVAWIIGITQAYRGSYYRLPIVGDMVAQMLGLGSHVKN